MSFLWIIAFDIKTFKLPVKSQFPKELMLFRNKDRELKLIRYKSKRKLVNYIYVY